MYPREVKCLVKYIFGKLSRVPQKDILKLAVSFLRENMYHREVKCGQILFWQAGAVF
jgi:hypothetical protein